LYDALRLDTFANHRSHYPSKTDLVAMKKTVHHFLLTTVLLVSNSLIAQRNCGSMSYLEQQISNDPERAARLADIEQATNHFVATFDAMGERAVITIPTVVHVVYANASQNISDALINAQIAQLNADFARQNSDAGSTPSVFQGVSVNSNIQFCLAQRDANGNATTGIVRRSTTTASFIDNDNVKFTGSGGDDAWPAGSYLNLWVCNLGNSLLGYAQFPGGAASTDGVVVLYSSVGSLTTPGTASPYNFGRTATHEVGHWLNLRHIWGDASCGSDLVSDTPTQQTSNGGCPAFPHVTCSNGPNGDMFMNYMDYTDDGCMNNLTAGQSARMNALFVSGGSRFSLVGSLGCQPPSGATCNTPAGLSAGSITTTSATVSWSAATGAVSYNLQYKLASASTWTTVNTASTSSALSGLASGTAYNAQVQTVCSTGSSAYSSAITFTTTAVGGCSDALEPNNSTAAPASIALPASINALVASSTDADYYSFTLAATSNISLALSNLAGDYDLRLLNSAGTQLASSANGSTTSESISYSNAAAGVYFIHAFGYNGAFSATQCYLLTASATVVVSGCSDTWESNNTSATAKTISVNTNITATIGSNGDIDWFKFTNTSAASKIKINLTNLPADYDVSLYRGTTTLLGTGQNGGTTSEQVISNTATVTTYYIKVVGYSGAFSASSCYTLRASTQSANWRELDAAVVPIEESTGSLLGLYPNPTNDKLNVDFMAGTDAALQVEVIDMTGRSMMSFQQVVAQGPNTFGLVVPEFSNGLYFLRITNGNERIQERFMIQR
jgi:Pregnancy-associated plasma protein-A/Secretion system C-terminal sorting domain/Bacterial pre-peptidase C-terminal domain/Fibronectin type III domain